MASTPTFVRPRLGWFLLLDGGIASLIAFSASEEAYEKAGDVVPLPSRSTIKAILAGTIVVHVLEALFAGRRARRHGLPAGRWARQTFVVGFPSLNALTRTIDAQPSA